MSRIVLLEPELTLLHVNCSNFKAEEIFHFQNFSRCLDENRAAATPRPDRYILLKFGQNLYQGQKLKFTKFGNHRVRGF